MPLGDICIYVDIAYHGVFFDKDKAMAMLRKVNVASDGMSPTAVGHIFRAWNMGRENHLRLFVVFEKGWKSADMVAVPM